jgi:hypothetical protein
MDLLAARVAPPVAPPAAARLTGRERAVGEAREPREERKDRDDREAEAAAAAAPTPAGVPPSRRR